MKIALKMMSVLLVLSLMAGVAVAASPETSDSSSWSAMIHEENSLVASVLYLPYLIGQLPLRLIDGILSPKPTSLSTTPPAAHSSPH